MQVHHWVDLGLTVRVVFRWSDLGPEDVDVVDYH